jgi:hypothetical protein
LKPLFSFAGQGVIIDVTEQNIKDIIDPENWILHEKVYYEPVIQAPDGGVKMEISYYICGLKAMKNQPLLLT